MRHFDTAAAYNNEAELARCERATRASLSSWPRGQTAGAHEGRRVAAAADRLAGPGLRLRPPPLASGRSAPRPGRRTMRRGEGLCRTLGAANCGLRHLKEFESRARRRRLASRRCRPTINDPPKSPGPAGIGRRHVRGWSKLGRLQLGEGCGPQDALNNMQGAQRDEGPDFSKVGFAERVRASAPERRERRGATPRHRPELVGVEGFRPPRARLWSPNQLEHRLASGIC